MSENVLVYLDVERLQGGQSIPEFGDKVRDVVVSEGKVHEAVPGFEDVRFLLQRAKLKNIFP
jgi:hypothetical protein